MSSRIPIPPHLGGGFVEDPGPAPLDKRARWWRARRVWTYPNNAGLPHWFPDLETETWRPDEIEECRRFAKLKRDE